MTMMTKLIYVNLTACDWSGSILDFFLTEMNRFRVQFPLPSCFELIVRREPSFTLVLPSFARPKKRVGYNRFRVGYSR